MQKEFNHLPTFLIIGAMKAGTTSLHDYLSKHPDIFMSKQKELDFFVKEKNWKLGLDWYKKQFPTEAMAVGESSPNYTKSLIFGGVAERIKATVPDAKLIYILRDPIKRLVSHYNHQFIDRKEFRTINEVVSSFDNNHYIDSSMYGKQLELYLKHFDASKILVITLEDLEKNPSEVLARVFDFIAVDPNKFIPTKIVSHKTSDKRRLTTIGYYISLLPMGLRICNGLSRLCWEEFTKPELSEENKRRLQDYFRKDLQSLHKFLGKEIYF